MRRACGGRKMPAELSNSLREPRTISPRSGRRRPAMIERIVVLPLPDGPKSAVIDESVENSASTTKPDGYDKRQRNSSRLTPLPSSLEILTHRQGDPSQCDRNNHQSPHAVFIVRVRQAVE